MAAAPFSLTSADAPPDGAPRAVRAWPWWSLLRVSLLAALAYGATGAVAILLAGPPGYATPLYPPAGIALATVLVYGRTPLAGIWLAAFALNAVVAATRAPFGPSSLAMAAVLATGAALQAGVGAALVRRFMVQPLGLSAPRDILQFVLLGGAVACTISATIATPALLARGTIGSDIWLANWLTWWFGDMLGVLIGAPLALTVIGLPRADWRPRLRTVALPTLLAVGFLTLGLLQFGQLDRERLRTAFSRDVDRLAGDMQGRLAQPLYALQALHSAAHARPSLDIDGLQQAARWWLAQPMQLQAMGLSERVPLASLPAFEATARAEVADSYKVFDRDGGAARAADNEVQAVRLLVPLSNARPPLGVNVLSHPPTRNALLASRDSGLPAASTAFRSNDQPDAPLAMVLYQALYRGDPADTASRRQQFRGAAFVAVRIDQIMAGMPNAAVTPGPPADSTPAAAGGPASAAGAVTDSRPNADLSGGAAFVDHYLRWCLVDPQPGVRHARLAGPVGCEQPATAGASGIGSIGTKRLLTAERDLQLGGRTLQLRISALPSAVPGDQREAAWMLSLAGLSAVGLLTVLLLTVTGHSRRTELAVQQGTAALRHENDERAQAEAALRDSEARLRSILDHVPLGVMFLDPQGRIIDGNPRLSEMAGLGVDALRGTAIAQLVHPDDVPRLRRLRRDLLGGVSHATLDVLRLRAGPWALDGQLQVRASVSALCDPHGRLLRMVAVLEDITEHLRLQDSERALHRAEAANRAKSEFLSRMSHELRTPLNAMIGFAQLLGLDHEPALVQHQREWTQQIQRAGWHLLELIGETLDLARIEAGAVTLTPAPVALQPLAGACAATVAAAAQARGIQVVHDIVPDTLAVVADAARLKQVLTNLLSNAVHYNRNGGSVTLRARRLPAAALPAAASVDATGDETDTIEDGDDINPVAASSDTRAAVDMAEITVDDTGLGMSPQQLAGLFEPYNRIGLAIGRLLVERMGGTLDATSTAGQGSTFRLLLPAAAPEAPEHASTGALLSSPEARQAQQREHTQRLVHYVEDNPTNIEVMRGVLAQRPHIRLETSTLGLDGLTAIRANRPDLVLLDMQLPDISGLELLRHLKQNDLVADIPVVVVSADATAHNKERALTSGALHYVTKPLDVAGFLAMIDAVLSDAESRWSM